MTIREFVDAYKAKNFMNTKQGVEEKSKWIRNELKIKSYIPFRDKRKIAEMIVNQNIDVVDGIKKYNSIDGYVSLVVASIIAHTNLQFSEDVISDYDLLAESCLLTEILSEFDSSHKEIEILLNMALDMELEDNEVNALVGHFLDKVLNSVKGLSEYIGGAIDGVNLKEMLNEENMAKIIGFLNK